MAAKITRLIVWLMLAVAGSAALLPSPGHAHAGHDASPVAVPDISSRRLVAAEASGDHGMILVAVDPERLYAALVQEAQDCNGTCCASSNCCQPVLLPPEPAVVWPNPGTRPAPARPDVWASLAPRALPEPPRSSV
ncbi:hypothetical protein [Zavarzinia sp. CC-PAN008]|uniref:hypothetical protein n=1 Tax=Zavarzinia sp. CC-PAN008 TaxID=3243332 RepID=UPI003F749D49